MSDLDPSATTASGDDPVLVIYCRSWCGDCMRAKRWLDSENVPYIEIDVDEDAEGRARAEAHNFGRLHTPTFELGDEVCVDFRPDVVKKMVGLP